MWNTAKKFYDYLITFPERLYPFNEKTKEGKVLSGERAYAYLKEKNIKEFDDAYSLKAPKLLLWRALFHFSGSVLIVFIADQMIKHMSFFNGFSLLVLTIICITAQEFYLHPHYYDQKPQKGIIDFITWMLPIFLYIVF
ncbi:MAG: hypothetical protein R3B55_02220 [Candidatus Paceibacterota bacterium]